MRSWIDKPLGLIVVFLVLLIARFYPMIFQEKVVVWGDNYSLMIPGKIFVAQSLKEGRLPLWNPYIFSGIPLIQDVNQSVLYFSSLIFVLFSPAMATNISVIMHVILISVGTYLLIFHLYRDKRAALLGAALMAFSTQVSGSINNLSTLQSVTWFPWLVWQGLKVPRGFKQQFIFAIFVLTQFMAGYPQHVIYGIGFAVLISTFHHWKKLSWQKYFKTWTITATLSVLVSSIVWLPFVEMLADSTRTNQSIEQAQVGSLKPGMMVKMFLPYFFDKQNEGIKWGPSWSGQPNVFFYVGNFALLLIVSIMVDPKKRKKEDWLYFLFIFGSLIFSLGEYLPGFELLQKLFPLLKFGRYPSMILIVTNLCLVMWVASIFVRIKNINKCLTKFYIVCWLGLLLMGLVLFYFVHFDFSVFWQLFDHMAGGRLSDSSFHNLDRDLAITQMIAENFISASIFSLLAWWLFIKQKKNWLILIMGLDILFHTQGMFYFAPAEIYQQQNNQVFQKLLKADPQYRVLTRDSNMPYTDYGTYWQAMAVRAPFGDSFIDEQELQTYSKLINIRNANTPNWNIVSQIPMVHGYATLLPKDYSNIWAKNDEARINFIDFIDPTNPQLGNWSVKYYVVDRLFEIKEEISFGLIAKSGQYELYELPNVKPRFRYANDQAVELLNFDETTNRITFDFVNNDNYDYLIVANRFDRNWQAKINNEVTQIENLQGMQKIKIKPGFNQLELKFVPRLFYLGSLITGTSLLVGWIISRRSR